VSAEGIADLFKLGIDSLRKMSADEDRSNQEVRLPVSLSGLPIKISTVAQGDFDPVRGHPEYNGDRLVGERIRCFFKQANQ